MDKKNKIIALAVAAAILISGALLASGHGPGKTASVQRPGDRHFKPGSSAADQPGADAPAMPGNNPITPPARNKVEVSAGAIDEASASALKRSNFTAYLRYQQRVSDGEMARTDTDPQARKASAEGRIKERLQMQLSKKSS